MNYGPLYYGDLVARGHPLNRGRVAWWLAVPWYMSGPRFIDICGRNHGALTNGPTWQATTRRGGWGELALDGSNDYALVKAGSILATLANSTICAWVKPTATTRAIYCERLAGNAIWKLQVANSNLGFVHRDDAGSLTNVASGPSLTNDGLWHNVAVTKAGTAVRFFTDGIFTGSTTLNGTDTLTAGETRIGGDAADGSVYFAGSLDDVSAYNRTLADSEIATLYNLLRRGYPGVLNRLRPLAALYGAAGGGAMFVPEVINIPARKTTFVIPEHKTTLVIPNRKTTIILTPERV